MSEAVKLHASALQPPIRDASGYAVQVSDLALLGLSAGSVELWRSKATPLGMSPDEYAYFVRSLWQALHVEGITDCDVRLKGSSVTFFSSAHKQMPWMRDDVADCFRQCRRRLPEEHELDRIAKILDQTWPVTAQRPAQRPFDVLYRIRLDRQPYDVDLQLSSDEIDSRARQRLSGLGLSADSHRVKSTTYDFVRKDLFETVFGHLALWAAHCSDVLGRTVSIAAFPSGGPPVRADGDLAPSSHFQDSDWRIFKVTDG